MLLVESATSSDRAAMAALLVREGLPVAGLAQAREAVVARDAGAIVGCAAIEVYDDGGLLRSVAVAPSRRGTGLGHQLVTAAIARATALGLPALFLLTTTAEQYFPRFGFEIVGRENVPPGVRGSVEFTSACPSTATVMRKTLS